MIGLLDADGRLHPNVLQEAAYLRLAKKAKLLQGPVYQVTNFAQVSLVGVAAGLELAIHHMTELPDRLRYGNKLQFLAGTNYFIDTKVIREAGGWDQHALVEDAELALRLYANKRITGHWLNVVEKEQTPPSFKVYRRQRERWARGHLYLISYIRHSNLSLWQKTDLLFRILTTQYRSFFDVGLFVFALALLFSSALHGMGPFFTILSFLLIAATPLLWDLYGFMYRQLAFSIDPAMRKRQQLAMSIKLFLFMPVLIAIQAIPRAEALYNYFFRRQEMEWYKTLRSKEITHS
jgi:cellulose synthase/poly-beta-1,6-N-acetylglucosamine synthase-like glycosyltransferase